MEEEGNVDWTQREEVDFLFLSWFTPQLWIGGEGRKGRKDSEENVVCKLLLIPIYTTALLAQLSSQSLPPWPDW